MTQRLRLLSTALCALVLSLISLPAAAQDFRGAVVGTITDSSGGALPGVTVTVTNVETNVATTTVTDAKGAYQVRHLNAGTYRVEAQLEGFRSVVRPQVQVRLGGAVRLDFAMELGAVQEVISVTASTPLLETSSAVTGQVVESEQIDRLPLGDGTAYMLTRLTPGLADASDLHFSRPMDNSGLSSIVANGARGGNEFTLDGAPNRVSPNNTSPTNNSGVVGFSPPSDAIAQFKVQTNAFDAQSGHTAGATVNLALKSGTNSLQGSAAYFNRSDSRAETPLLTKRAGGEKPTREYDRYTAMLSGPILRDRTFFMIAFERLRDVQPEPATYTVPTMKMRQGDFSEFDVTIYDPLTASGSNNGRTAFEGNIIPQDRIHPIARAYAQYYPEPNRSGSDDNYFTNQLRPYDYSAVLARIDHNITGAQKVFGNAYWNRREEDRYNWALGAANAVDGAINGFKVTQGFDYRSNTGATLGYTSVLTNSLVLDVIGAWSQFGEWRDPAQEFDPASLGFSAEAVRLMNGYRYLPFFTFGGFSSTNSNSRIASLGSQRSDFGTGFERPFTNISFVPTVSWLYHGHSIRGGYELRRQRWEIDSAEYGAGRYHFNGAYTRRNNSAPLNDPAQSWAQFLLGLPTTGTNTVASTGSTASQFEIAADADYRQNSHSLFIQDDWRTTDRLTVNFGARVEMHQGMTEVQNRALSGFNTTIVSPIEEAALARYQANPIPEIPANAFRVRGGLEFADGPIYDDIYKFLPRAAASYMLTPRTVLRGGVGLFSYDYYFDAGNQLGFSQPTGIITTEDGGATFQADLGDPIPSGQVIQPPGSSLGAATAMGLNVGTVVPAKREVPYYTRWQIGAQQDIGWGTLVEVFYVGSRGTNLPVLRQINGLPFEYLSTSRERDTAHESYLSQRFSNPFRGMLPGTGLNGSTITRLQFLRPFPQFLSVVTEEYAGSDQYDAGSIRVEKRFAGGTSILGSYTYSRLTDKLNYLNPANGILEDRVSPNDRPHRATFATTFDLPFGRGERWGSEWNAFTDAVLGGWSVSATYQYQSGFPLLWNSNIYYDPDRDPRELKSNIGGKCPDGEGTAGLDCPAWDLSGFYVQGGRGRSDSRIQLGNNVRYFPSTLANVRSDDIHLLDLRLAKTFELVNGIKLRVLAEAINALNYTVLWNPNLNPRSSSFGFVNRDRNNPRDIQLGAKLTF